ncbi:MAG: winged helix-turn-helix transcriptional regulator [Chlorobiales bacterium]|jgi:ArsR family transcriptional regulator, arsenate/arsenite/antimonite-responsive transcriptional repressor|nr:winged helix-turn-helix transcriptional regulator [Chlorobiales bacterium]
MNPLLKIFKALADGNRLRILKMLEVRPLCVCEITDVLGLATSTVSKHLSILRDAGLITDDKQGKWVNYSLNSPTGEAYLKELLPLMEKWLEADRTVSQDIKKVAVIDRNKICQI